MLLNPQEILEEYKSHNIDLHSTVDLLISVIDNAQNKDDRIKAILSLRKVDTESAEIFKFLENLLLSDTSEFIRNEAAKYLRDYFAESALIPMKWAFKHDPSYECQMTIISFMIKLQSQESKDILIEDLKRIKKMKSKWNVKDFIEIKFKRAIKKFLKVKKYNSLTHDEIADILINYKTMKHLAEIYPNIYFQLNLNSLVEGLDLSDYLEYEVKGMPWGWKNNIKSISEIPGLINLRDLKQLNLSNNQIRDFKGITKLRSLTHLILPNNRISENEDISLLQNLHNLHYLNITNNPIAEKLKKEPIKTKLKIVLSNPLVERFE